MAQRVTTRQRELVACCLAQPRSVARAHVSSHCDLPAQVQLFHCRLGANSRKVSDEDKLFNPADPSGLFNLSMAVPYDCVRTLLPLRAAFPRLCRPVR